MASTIDARKIVLSPARAATGFGSLYGVYLLPTVVDANARFVRAAIVLSAAGTWTLKDSGNNTILSGSMGDKLWSLVLDVASLANDTYTLSATGGYSATFQKTSATAAYTLSGPVALACPSPALSGHTGTTQWPCHLFFPVPIQQPGFSSQRLALTEDGSPITTSVHERQRWGNGLPRVLHAKALGKWVNGTMASYAADWSTVPANQSPLASIVGNVATIATGVCTIQIDRVKGGITSIVRDGVAALGTLGDWAGPFATDEASITHYVENSKRTRLVVEEQGNAHCVLRHDGWLASGTSLPLRFATWYTFYRNSGVIEIDHCITFACNMQAKSFAEIGYRFPASVASCTYTAGGSSFSENVAAGDPAIWRAHKWDASTITRNSGSTNRAALDGVFSLRSSAGANAAATFFAREFSERYPAGARLTDTDFRLYAYPPGLPTTWDTSTRTAIHNVALGLSYHDGPRLSCAGDANVISALQASSTFQTESGGAAALADPTFLASGNASGRTLRQKITLVVSTTTEAQNTTSIWKQLHDKEPILLPSAQYIGDTAALGEDFSAVTAWTEAEDFARNVFTAQYNAARTRAYGWANYGDCHHDEWVANDGTDRAYLERPWMANHYGTCGAIWYNAARTQNAQLLSLARRIAWHHACIDSIAHDPMGGPPSGGRLRPTYRGHYPGAICRTHLAVTHFGEAPYGNASPLDFAGTDIHWADISATLLPWLIGGDRWAREMFNRYSTAIAAFSPTAAGWGTNRDSTTPFGNNCLLYSLSFDPFLLIPIRKAAAVLFGTLLPNYSGGSQTALHWPLWYDDIAHDTAVKQWAIDSLNAAVVQEGVALLVLGALSTRGNISPTKASELKRIIGGLVNRGHVEPATNYDGYGPTPWLDDFGLSSQISHFGKVITGTGGALYPSACCYPFPAGAENNDVDQRWLWIYVQHGGGVLSFDWVQDTSFPGNQNPPIEVKIVSPNGATNYPISVTSGPANVWTDTGYRVAKTTYASNSSVPSGLVAIRAKCGSGVLYGPMTGLVEASCILRNPVAGDAPSHAAFRCDGYVYPRAASVSLSVEHWNPGQYYEGKTPIRVKLWDKDSNLITDTSELRVRRTPVNLSLSQSLAPYRLNIECYDNSRLYMRATSATAKDRIATFSLNSTDCVAIDGALTAAGL